MEPRSLRYRRFAFPLIAVAAVGLLVLGASGDARASGLPPIYGFPTNDGFALTFYQGLLQPYPITPGTLVFGDEILVEFLNLGLNRTITVTTFQAGTSKGPPVWFNQTFGVTGRNVSIFSLNLPSVSDQRDTTMCVDGGCEAFQHVTPVTLLPSGIFNVGGLDLLLLGITIEFGILIFPTVILARWLTRKALWSPKFRAWLWAPHVVAGFLILVVLDFQLFDALFGGLGFVLMPIVFDLLFFGWVLHLFNVARPVEVLRPDPQAGHRLRYNRWRIWVGEWPDGTKVLVGSRWRDWWARLFGHAPVLMPANVDGTKRGAPAEAPLLTYRTETRSEREDRRAKAMRRSFRQRPGRESPLDDFQVAGDAELQERDAPKLLYWTASDEWLNADMPHLSIHRTVRVPAKVNDAGNVVEPAHTVSKLAWPHYVDPKATVGLAGIHYYDTPVAALGWIRAEKAYRRIEDLRAQNVALRTTTFIEADESAQVQVAEVFRLMERERMPLSDEEADEETRREAVKAKEPGGTVEESEESPRPGALDRRHARGAGP